jgi:hypothetical protein
VSVLLSRYYCCRVSSCCDTLHRSGQSGLIRVLSVALRISMLFECLMQSSTLNGSFNSFRSINSVCCCGVLIQLRSLCIDSNGSVDTGLDSE